jgi:hypothetical protein
MLSGFNKEKTTFPVFLMLQESVKSYTLIQITSLNIPIFDRLVQNCLLSIFMSQMAGRKKEFNEEQVLQCAAELFMVKGFEATSTEELLTAMNINKGSLYWKFRWR